ncbi:uncharacterized protein LOC144284256 isoform X2 [Canis aureus]
MTAGAGAGAAQGQGAEPARDQELWAGPGDEWSMAWAAVGVETLASDVNGQLPHERQEQNPEILGAGSREARAMGLCVWIAWKGLSRDASSVGCRLSRSFPLCTWASGGKRK